MFSNSITKIIVCLLLGLLVFSTVTDAATTTYSGVTNTYSGVTNTYSGVTTTYNGTEQGENVTNTAKTSIPVATVTEKASQTETATSSKKTSGFEVVLAIMALIALCVKLNRRLFLPIHIPYQFARPEQ